MSEQEWEINMILNIDKKCDSFEVKACKQIPR